jgi:YggT family protein
MSASEPPPPQRGQTASERASDATAAEEKVAAAPTVPKRVAAAAKPSFLLAQADGYPVGIKQFLQFCLLLIYPAWLFMVLVGWAGYGVLWVLFAPLRIMMKRKDPEAYAASQRK